MVRKEGEPVDEGWSETELNDPYANDESFNDTSNFSEESFGEEVVIEETTESFSSNDSFSDGSGMNRSGSFVDNFNKETDKVMKQLPLGKDGKPITIPKLNKQAECLILATGGFVQGGIAGFVFGSFNSAITGVMQGQHRMPGFARFIGAGSRQTAGQFSVWLGTFYGARCAVNPFIKNDQASSAVGGFAAGFVSGMRTRNLKAMVAQGIVSSALVTLFDMFSAKPM